MFSNTLTLHWFSDEITMVRINQDKYASEYRGQTATGDKLVMNIRHSTYVDKTRGSISVDRHNVELTFAKVPNESGYVDRRKVYLVFEADSNVVISAQADPAKCLRTFITDGNLDMMSAWES